MTFNPDLHHRRSIRLRDFDYTRGGAYFVTLCTAGRECLFGEMVNGAMQLNPAGMTVDECWRAIPDHSPNAGLDEYVVMPNHVHGIVLLREPIDSVGARHASPDSVALATRATHASPLRGPGPKSGAIGAIVGSFKSAVTKRINTVRGNPGAPVWQRNFYERVIRDEGELDAIRQYINDNSTKWEDDENHPGQI